MKLIASTTRSGAEASQQSKAGADGAAATCDVRGKARATLTGAVFFIGLLLGACGPSTVSANHAFAVDVEVIDQVESLGETFDVDIEITSEANRDIEIDVSSIVSWIEVDSDSELELAPGETSRIHLHVTCPDTPMVRHSWLLLESRSKSLALPIRIVCAAGDDDVDPEDDLLRWEPPLLEDASIVRVESDSGSAIVRLDRDEDYLVLLPDHGPLEEGLGIIGGHNVVVMAGEVEIPWQGDDPSIASRRGLIVRDSTGTVHIEGVLFHGEDISEGIQLSTPDAIIQLLNVGVRGLHARDQDGFTDNHPDVIQTYGNVAELRVDGLTGTTDYQGLFLSASLSDDPHGPVTLRRVNIRGEPTARYLFWVSPRSSGGNTVLEDVWLEVPDERRGGIGRAVWPDSGADSDNRPVIDEDDDVVTVVWPESMSPRIIGKIHSGRPPGGDFVPSDTIGTGYESPGYELP